MNDRPFPPEPADPSALTQPIPVVTTYAAPAPLAPGPPRGATIVNPPYLHQFGSIPFYVFSRFAAFAIDFLGVAFTIAAFGFHAFDVGFIALAGRNEAGFDALALTAFAGALALEFLCEALFGTTLGKLLFALQVRRTSGRHAGVWRAFVRGLLRPVDLLLIGPILALITPRHQRLGDFAAGTVVSRSRLGAFASLIGFILLACIGYAQVAFGGGVTSAIGVTAETANYAPAAFERGRTALGFGKAVAPQPLAEPTDAPSPQPEASGSTTIQ